MLQAWEWILLGAASVGAIILGVSRHRPARVAPWLLLAASITCIGVGDVFYDYGLQDIADVWYLSMFLFVILALLQLTRVGAALMSRARLIDLLAFTCAVMLVFWVFVIGDSTLLGRLSAADVIGDLLLIGVAIRLVTATWRNWSAILILTGAVGMLAGDIVYPLAPGDAAELGYVALYVCWGAAALHPSMTALTEPTAPRATPWRSHWAALLGLSVATPPLVLLAEAVEGSVTDGVVIAVAGAITLVLTFTRLSDSVLLSTQALRREQALREATAALVAAADETAVDEAVRAAAAQLLPPGDLTRAVLTSENPEPPAAGPAHARSWWSGDTLVCPLRLEPLAVARPSGGALLVTGRHESLTACRDSLEVLAGQTALALDRITLVDAVGRRDSDLYLRTVIRNTADLMLVIDEDRVIRYASPALKKLLGRPELAPLTSLTDLVHTDDTGQVGQALRRGGDGVLYCSLQRADQTQILIEATYRDLREDRLVQGYVITIKDVTTGHDPAEHIPHQDHVDELPAWVNRRSAQHKFRY